MNLRWLNLQSPSVCCINTTFNHTNLKKKTADAVRAAAAHTSVEGRRVRTWQNVKRKIRWKIFDGNFMGFNYIFN